MELQTTTKIRGIFTGSKRKFFILGALLLLLIAAVLYLFVFGHKAGSNTALQQRTARVVRGNLNVTVTGSGPITSSNRLSLTSAVSGTVKSVNFKEGDIVKKGDVLVEIDDTDAVRNIEQIKNNIAQTQLSVDNNSKSLNGLTVKAPFNGRVTGLAQIKVGDDVQKNTTLLTITDTSKLKVSLPFSGSVIKEISNGMKATVNIPDFMQSVEGTVTYISNYPYTSSSGGEVYDVEITLNNPGSLRDGLAVNADIVTNKGTRTSIDSGKLEFVNYQVIKSLSGGTVKSLKVKENQYVKADETLMSVENDDLAVSAQTTDLKMQDLNSQLEQAESSLNDYKITAPIDGTIVSMNVVVGDELKPSAAIATVIDTGHYEFSVDIDELDIAKIKVGQNVNITVDALSEATTTPITGKVTKIAVEGTSSGGVTTYPVTIQLDKADNIRSGMNANAEIMISEKTDVLMVPIEAVQKMGNRNLVMVRGNGQSGTNGQFEGWGAQGGTGKRQNGASGSNSSSGSGNNNGNSANRNFQRRSGSSSNAALKYYANAIPTPVELGINNDTYIEIVSGLEEGQVVILPLVTASSSTQNSTFGGMGGFGGFGGMGGFGGNNRNFNNSGNNNRQRNSGSGSNNQSTPRD